MKEMRLAGIDSIEAANHFLEKGLLFKSVLRWHRAIHAMPIEGWGANITWKEILSPPVVRRKVADDRTVSWDGNRWGVPREEVCAAYGERRWKSNGDWTALTGCASGTVILRCVYCPDRSPASLPAYGLQDDPQINYQEFTKVLLRTIHGGHFNMAEKRDISNLR